LARWTRNERSKSFLVARSGKVSQLLLISLQPLGQGGAAVAVAAAHGRGGAQRVQHRFLRRLRRGLEEDVDAPLGQRPERDQILGLVMVEGDGGGKAEGDVA